MKKKILIVVGLLVSWLIAGILGWWLAKNLVLDNQENFFSPLVVKEKKLPLLAYTIPNLINYDFQVSEIQLEKQLDQQPDYTTFLFSYTTLNKKMTGAINIPVNPQSKAIIMVRGYVPLEGYQSGMGTKNAAAVFAKKGYITLSPDFFGYGGSDSEPADTWEARFIKPINLIELIKTVEDKGIPTSLDNLTKFLPKNLGIWAHSNGGQIALTSLEILNQPIPTSLWAPVTAPFPYSIMFFSDEVEDEGKDMRQYVAIFERDYDAFDFSLTKHLDLLTGPIQIQQGEADDAIPPVWSDEFVDRLKTENKKRAISLKQTDAATSAAIIQKLQPITIDYLTHNGADHNLRGSWDTAVQQDLDFFKKYLNQ